MTQPEHSIYSWSSMEPLDTLEMHVLARAYRAAWRSLHARDPVSRHVIVSLDVMIVFGNQPPPGPAANKTLHVAWDTPE
jgi:hypothetical protein